MSITEKTRKARVERWKAKKAVWVTKLASAKNQNDTDVAKLMIGEAEDALSRLESKGEVLSEDNMYKKSNIDKITKKVKADKLKRDPETPLKTKEDTSSIGP